MVKDSQSTHPRMRVELEKIRDLSNSGIELKLESQTNKLKRVQRRYWDCKNTGIAERIKGDLLR